MTAGNGHPSKDITGSEGLELHRKRIVLCVTASVAAYRAIDLARLLMRHGAEVRCVITSSASGMMVSPEMMKWATGNPVVISLTGDLEHVALADYGMSDLIIVYPCTANTIGKAAQGIDDTPVTSVLTIALGSKIPVIMAPAMHQAMYENTIILENIKKLASLGVTFMSPTLEEGKAKVPEPEDVLELAIQTLTSRSALLGKRVLVTAGSTVEYIDPIRVVTSLSSGKMGIAIARQASLMGADVTVVLGVSTEQSQFRGRVIQVKTSSEMEKAVAAELGAHKYDVVIMAAAVADYAPAKKAPSKIDTRKGKLDISFVPTIKIVNGIRKASPNSVLVAFKAEFGVADKVLQEKARRKLRECKADFVVANDLAKTEPGLEKSEAHIVGRGDLLMHIPLTSKQIVAKQLMELVAGSLT